MAKKKRTEIQPDIAAKVLFEADRTCCVCRQRKPVQIHHIDDDPSNGEGGNLAVLCLDCHRETQIRGGFDRKLDAHQIRLYRADWLSAVEKLRVGLAGHPSDAISAGQAGPPNLVAVRPWHTRVRLADRNAAIEQSTAPMAALIAPFRNDPDAKHPHVGSVRQLVATVTLNAAPDFPVTGHWLSEPSPYVSLAPGQQRVVVVAVVGGKFASLLSDLRDANSGEVELKHFWVAPSTVNETELSVSLSAEGKLLLTQRYRIKLSPFPEIQFA